MDHDEFVTELCAKLNSFIKRSPDAARFALSQPLPQAGLASVAQVFGMVSMPEAGDPNSLFLMPRPDAEGRLDVFEAISGIELARRANENAAKGVEQETQENPDEDESE